MPPIEVYRQVDNDDDSNEEIDHDYAQSSAEETEISARHEPNSAASYEEGSAISTPTGVMGNESTKPESRGSNSSWAQRFKPEPETVCLLPSLKLGNTKAVCGKRLKYLWKEEIEKHVKKHIKGSKYHPSWVGTTDVDPTQRVPCGQCAAAMPPVTKRIQLRSLTRHLCEAHFHTKNFTCAKCGSILSRDETYNQNRHACGKKKECRRVRVKQYKTGACQMLVMNYHSRCS